MNIKILVNSLFCGTGFLLLSCGTQNPPKEEVKETVNEKSFILEKLIGTWKNEDGKSFERWTKDEEGNYHSLVYELNEKDTVIMEVAEIFEVNNQWVFENLVTGQNNGKTVQFTSSQLNENMIQFSNPVHDFPSDINYTLSDLNTLNAFIVGKNEQGGTDTIPFNYTRLK